MKEGEKPDEEQISPERLGINQRYWAFITLSLHNKGLINLEQPEITMDGIEYMEENPAISLAINLDNMYQP